MSSTYHGDGDGGVPGFNGTIGPLMRKTFEIFGELGPSPTCKWDAARTSETSDP